MWAIKFKPQKIEEVYGQETAILQLRNFITTYRRQEKKAIMLHGPVGCGKTCLVYIIAKHLNYDVLELNASEFRDREKIEQLVKPATQISSIFSSGRIILFDDINAIGKDDAGAISAILECMQKSKFPFVFTINNPWIQKLSELRQKSILVEMKKLDQSSTLRILENISRKVGTQVSREILEVIALKSRGDARAAINDLQTVAGLQLNAQEAARLLGDRDKEENIFNAIRNVMKGHPRQVLNAFESVDLTTDEIIFWLDENIPLEYKAEELAHAYNALSQADIFRGRIIRQQYWRFLAYVSNFMTAGLAAARKQGESKGFTPYKPASRILKMWQAKQRNARKKEIVKKLGTAMHSSRKKVMRDMPFLQIILKDRQTADELKLTAEEREFFRRQN